jgi:hypothetical protein
MNTTPSSGVMKLFRLTNEPGGMGLSCTSSGVSLAGVPLLRRSRGGFVPRTESESASCLRRRLAKIQLVCNQG